MLRRRRTDTFGLSFLDCICCGFGAVILFYVMMSAQGGIRRVHRTDDLKSEVNRLAERVDAGTRSLVVLRNTLEKTQSDTATEEANAVRILAEIKEQNEKLSSYDATSVARREHVEQLQADVKAMEDGKRRLEAGSEDRGPPGQDTRMTPTGGERRYITGITLRGKRILILVDRSASMLHEDLVSIIRLRNSSDEAKRAASKWRRTIEIVNWLVMQMPPATRYQIYGFNTRAEPLLPNTAGTWLDATSGDALARNIAALHGLVPRDGTSLINAFAAARTLNPLPDQIILITDGLPTQGKSPGQRKYIDAGARARLFDDAIAVLPENVPTDVVLLPMKGDVQAAHRFWRLARLTNGTLLAPSRDWP
jgi:hypothetical protein